MLTQRKFSLATYGIKYFFKVTSKGAKLVNIFHNLFTNTVGVVETNGEIIGSWSFTLCSVQTAIELLVQVDTSSRNINLRI